MNFRTAIQSGIRRRFVDFCLAGSPEIAYKGAGFHGNTMRRRARICGRIDLAFPAPKRLEGRGLRNGSFSPTGSP